MFFCLRYAVRYVVKNGGMKKQAKKCVDYRTLNIVAAFYKKEEGRI